MLFKPKTIIIQFKNTNETLKGWERCPSSRAILIECKDIQMRHQKDEKEGTNMSPTT